MKRKLQIFISSTYLDLKEERQAAVEAILESGHIPAGMELFAAGDKSQLETIRRWIDDSDVYLLILGGRYGSIEPESGKSYIELEYLHAVDRKMPHFALVLKESAIEAKVKRNDLSFLERDNPGLLKQFKDTITRKMCSFVEDTKDIKLSIYKSLRDVADSNPGLGWVPAKEAPDQTKVAGDSLAIARENSELHRAILEERIAQLTTTPNRDAEFARIFNGLSKAVITYDQQQTSPWNILLHNKEIFVNGINDIATQDKNTNFILQKVIPHLRMHGLIEDYRKPGAKYGTYRTSKLGNEFLTWTTEKLLELRQGTGKEVQPSGRNINPGVKQGTPASKSPAQKKPLASLNTHPPIKKKPKQ